VSNPLKKLAGQTVVYGLGTILPRFLNYFLTPILTYAFSAAQFGINSELFAYISFLNVIFTYGMETTFFNFNSKLENKQDVYDTAFLSLLLSSVFFSLLLLIFSRSIANYLSTPNAVYLPEFVTWSILIIATDAITVIPFAKLRTENKALKFSLFKLTNVLVNFSLTVFFVEVCKKSYDNCEDNFYASLYNPQIGIGYGFLSMLIANCVSLILLSKQFISIRFKLDPELLKRMLVYAWPLVILGLAAMVNDTLDKILLKKLIADKSEGQIAQGIYGGCNKIAVLMTIFINAFRFASEPFFFGKAREKDSKQTYAIVMKYFVIFCLTLFLATVLNLNWIQGFVGPDYRSGLKVVPILLFANLCLGVVYNLSIWYKLSSQTRFGAIIAISGASITLIVNVVFVPKYSYMACAWATMAAYGGMMVLSYMLGQKYFPIKYNLRALSVYTVLTFGFYFLSFTYSGIESGITKTILNNLLILIFVWIVYKLEINNLKKLNSNVNTNNQSHKPV
jgi:O-antigen/teichoic acid export membrane protein